jgi:hypothetical protein
VQADELGRALDKLFGEELPSDRPGSDNQRATMAHDAPVADGGRAQNRSPERSSRAELSKTDARLRREVRVQAIDGDLPYGGGSLASELDQQRPVRFFQRFQAHEQVGRLE